MKASPCAIGDQFGAEMIGDRLPQLAHHPAGVDVEEDRGIEPTFWCAVCGVG